MVRMTYACAVLAVGLVPAQGTAQSVDTSPPRVFVLDPAGPTVTALASDSGQVLGRAGLDGQPARMLLSPDGSRLLVLDSGPGKHTMRFGYHPTGKSRATLLDARSLEVLARTELGWNVSTGFVWGGTGNGGHWILPADERHVVLACLGYSSNNPKDKLARELVSLDLGTGEVTGRLVVERSIDTLLASADGRTAVVYSGRETPKGSLALPAELRFVDLATLGLLATLALDGDPGPPTLSPDGAYLYLLESGKPDKKPEKNVNGRVQVVSLADRAHVVNLDAGRAPRGLVVDEEGDQLFVLSAGDVSVERTDLHPGVLRVVRGAEAVAAIPVGEEPLFLRVSPDRERVHVVSEKVLTTVDLPSLSLLDSARIKSGGTSLLTAGGGKTTVKELELTRDGRRGYVLYAESSKLGVLDLQERKLLAEVTTGRGGVKLGKFMAAVAATALSYYAGSAGASASGGGFFTYQVYGVAPANTSLVLSEDEKHVYVLNTHSNDVTIVDTATFEVLAKIGVGGSANRLERLAGGAVAVTTGADTLHLIDTGTQRKVAELPDGGNYVFGPGKRYAAAIGKQVVYILDGATLRTLGTATGFKGATQLLFQPLAEPAVEGDGAPAAVEAQPAALSQPPTAPAESPTPARGPEPTPSPTPPPH